MMREVSVSMATTDEWPAIEAMRSAYYASRCAPVQHRDYVEWWVALADGKPAACQSYVDDVNAKQRWVMDTYCYPSREGKLALASLARAAHERADREGYTLLGVTETDNLPNLYAMQKRGWSIVGILLHRLPAEAQ